MRAWRCADSSALGNHRRCRDLSPCCTAAIRVAFGDSRGIPLISWVYAIHSNASCTPALVSRRGICDANPSTTVKHMATLRQFIQTSPSKAMELFGRLLETSDTATKTRERLFGQLKEELELI